MSRHIFTQEERSKGGKIGGKKASTEDKRRAGAAGFERTCETHPYFARKWLQHQPGMKKSATYRQVHVVRPLIARKNTGGKRQPMSKGVK